MRSRLAACVTAVWAALAGPGMAGDPVVVELFTSQGCSSCPPADEIFGELAQRDDIIALALHVDYWDYIGWKDIFASPAFTERQRKYAYAAGTRTVYTPQMVVGGRDHVTGTKPMKLAERIEAHNDIPNPVSVDLTRSGDRLTIVARPEGRVPRDMVVQLVTYTPEATVKVRRGENAGRTLRYHNIVRDWIELDTWNGAGEYRTTVQVDGGQPLAVVVQEAGTGPILGAAKSQ